MSDENADPPSPPEVETSECSILDLNRRRRNAKRTTTEVCYELENLAASPSTNEEETQCQDRTLDPAVMGCFGGHPSHITGFIRFPSRPR